MSWRALVLSTLTLFASCRGATAPPPAAIFVHHHGEIAWVEQGLGDLSTPLSITARLEFSSEEAPSAIGVVSRTAQGQIATHYMIYERRGEQESWGVYGLQGAKNGMVMPLPFDPHSIRYEGRSSKETLVDFLQTRGATVSDAQSFLEAVSPELFAEGLRVIFALDEERAPDVKEQFLESSSGPFLLSIELEPQPD